MAAKVIGSLILLGTCVTAQFIDFYQTVPVRYEQYERPSFVVSPYIQQPERDRRITVTTPPTRTTTKPKSSQRNKNNNRTTQKPRNKNEYLYSVENFELFNNNNNNRNKNREEYNINNRERNNSNRDVYSDPVYTGVKPASVYGQPITNRPVVKTTTNRPVVKTTTYRSRTSPRTSDAITFPEPTNLSPTIKVGIDEDTMSEVEKAKYIEVAEQMCDKYKSLNVKQLQAIPLLPTPDVVQLNVSECARTVPLIVGGKVVSIKEFPHMALVGWQKIQEGGYSWKCGGSLISEQFVLTAAHCSSQERDNTVVAGPPSAVQLGSTFLDDPGALVVRVSTVIRHPKYRPPPAYYDIALLKLTQTVKFSEVIKPACLGAPPAVGRPVIATGWGQTEFRGDQSYELRSVSLSVWETSDCSRVHGETRKLPRGVSAASQLCAGERDGGRDTCQGDSGGPLQIQDECLWRVVGVTSVGRACGAISTPGVYARVSTAFIARQVFADRISEVNNKRNKQQYGGEDYNRQDKQQYGGEDYNRQDKQQYGGEDYNRRDKQQNDGEYYNSESNNRNKPQQYGDNYNNNQNNNRRVDSWSNNDSNRGNTGSWNNNNNNNKDNTVNNVNSWTSNPNVNNWNNNNQQTDPWNNQNNNRNVWNNNDQAYENRNKHQNVWGGGEQSRPTNVDSNWNYNEHNNIRYRETPVYTNNNRNNNNKEYFSPTWWSR